jgi:hypothetical protein
LKDKGIPAKKAWCCGILEVGAESSIRASFVVKRVCIVWFCLVDMGGHGGLNILPQKSWNVYNFDNREKVRKDEEEAARQEAIQQQQARQRDAEFRLEKLRAAAAQAKSSTSTGTTRVQEPRITQGEEEEDHLPKLRSAVAASNEEKGSSIIIAAEQQRPQHFNFFSGVEEIVEGSGQEGGKPQDDGKERKRGEGRVRGSKGRDDFRDFRDKKAKKEEAKAPVADDEVYGFGYGLIGKNGKRPWYSTKTFMIDRTGDEGAATQDVRPRSTEERQKKKQRKTVEELRAERLKREEQEQQKAKKLVVAQLRLGGHHGADRAGQPYYNQSYGNAR